MAVMVVEREREREGEREGRGRERRGREKEREKVVGLSVGGQCGGDGNAGGAVVLLVAGWVMVVVAVSVWPVRLSEYVSVRECECTCV